MPGVHRHLLMCVWCSLQANNSLRAVGHLSRNELRYLVRASDNEGLPYLIMEQLTGKVHQFVNVSWEGVGQCVSETKCRVYQSVNVCCMPVWVCAITGAYQYIARHSSYVSSTPSFLPLLPLLFPLLFFHPLPSSPSPPLLSLPSPPLPSSAGIHA